jgi:hypothetical protein
MNNNQTQKSEAQAHAKKENHQTPLRNPFPPTKAALD